MVVDLLFANPILTVRYVQDRLGVSQPGATNLLRRLGAVGIVQEVGTRPGSGIDGSAATCSESLTLNPGNRAGCKEL